MVSGLLSPARYFIETMIVSDLRCLPGQYGYTDDSFNRTSYDLIGLALGDKVNATRQSCNGWYWGFPRILAVSLSIRILSLILIKVKYNRKLSIFSLSEGRVDFINLIELALFGCSLAASIYLIIH